MKVFAPAKINLFLDIAGLRPDGYHEIETVFQTVSLSDEMRVVPAGEISLKVLENGGNGCPSDSGNIVWKAAERFFREFGINGGCAIRLKKNLPVQAGLGGGSSDGAAVLKALEKLFLKKSGAAEKRSFQRMAAGLGADVPFFLSGGCALAGGIGEKLTPLPTPKFWAVVVKPKIGLSTKEVYGWYDALRPDPKSLTQRQKIRKMVNLIKLGKPSKDWSGFIYNCFENAVTLKVPEIAQVKQALLAQGAFAALLSGSGSALFGLVGAKSDGEKLRQAMARMGLQAWVVQSVS